MASQAVSRNPAASVIRSLLQHACAVSLHSENMLYPLEAGIKSLDLTSGRLLLEAEYAGADIEQYLPHGTVNIDLEARKGGVHHGVRETFSLNNIAARLLKTDSLVYQLECQLPFSLFAEEKRGSLRIPFILGMQARISLDVYRQRLSVTGSVRNLSMGGCLVDVALADLTAINIGQVLPGATLEFPNGERFHARVQVRHIRPFGYHGHAAIGLQFLETTSDQQKLLFHLLTEAELEVAYRAGLDRRMPHPSPLFAAGSREPALPGRVRDPKARQSPMERGIMGVAYQLQLALMYIKSRNIFPGSQLYDSVDTLRFLVEQDRQAFLYALSALRHEPEWVRHAVQVAGRTADMLILRDPHDARVREATMGALLHTLGKPLLTGPKLPSLEMTMGDAEKALLRRHVDVLLCRLSVLGWQPGAVCLDIIQNANERLDGSGYPQGKRADALSAIVRLVSVIKAVNRLCHGRNAEPSRSPLEAYCWLRDAGDAYDQTVLMEYIQIYGPYPVGSLARFSGGFLAWVMDIDAKGVPTRVQVVKNLRFPDTNINNEINRADFAQLGQLESIVDPAGYGLEATAEA